MKRLIPLFFAVIFFAGCDENKPEGIISRSKMISLLTDVHLIDGYISTSRIDTRKMTQADLYRAVFKKYGTDSVQFKKSVQYYSRTPEDFEKMYKVIQKNLEDEQQLFLKQKEEEEKNK